MALGKARLRWSSSVKRPQAPLSGPPIDSAILTALLYDLYDVTVDSQLELPEARKAPPGATPAASIRVGPVDTAGSGIGRQLGPFVWAAPGMLWLQVPGVGRFLVTGGDRIVVEPDPAADADSVRVFLLGSALGAMLLQRGLIVLHGNAVVIGDACLVCVGRTGAGKSTLAAEFMRRGYPILADDVVPIDAACRALPGLPRIKLCQDALERLDLGAEGLRRIRPGVAKFNLPVIGSLFRAEAAPVRWIYVLEPSPRSEVLVEVVRGMDRLAPLRNHTYRIRYVEGMDLRSGHLASCGRLASCADVRRVRRPERGVEPAELADRLLSELAV